MRPSFEALRAKYYKLANRNYSACGANASHPAEYEQAVQFIQKTAPHEPLLTDFLNFMLEAKASAQYDQTLGSLYKQHMKPK